MYNIRPLAQPETIVKGGLSITLSHTMEILHINPRSADALTVRSVKGYLDENGTFVDYGDHLVQTLDQTAFAALLADTTGGKHAGDFRLSDIAPALAAQAAARAAAQNLKP